MKIYAKQVPPEYQESPLFNGDFPENIALFGNRDYIGHTFDLFDDLPNILEELGDAWDDLHAGRCAWYNSWVDALADLARPQGRPAYTREERKRAWPALLAAWDGWDKTIICDALELITGRAWDWCTLRGCCQGDWEYCIYPVDEWDSRSLERLEMEFFNTGSEWIIHAEETEPGTPEDITGWSCYCYEWSIDEIRKEIADICCDTAENVVLYKYDGMYCREKYKEV